MSLTNSQIRHLRGSGHSLKPVVIIGGSGLTEGVMQEIDLSLEHHELMKVKVNAGEREERDAMIEAICTQARCELVQRIGHIALLYRPALNPRLQLPQ